MQGVGASGIYSMIMVIAPTLAPPEKFGKYIAMVSTVFILASVLGPILGGAINSHGQWRWVFLLNYAKPINPHVCLTDSVTVLPRVSSPLL